MLIANVDPASDAGAYTCTVHNRAGEQAKREILLEVVNPPLIEPFSFPQSVQQGGRTQVTCSVSSGNKFKIDKLLLINIDFFPIFFLSTTFVYEIKSILIILCQFTNNE